MVHLTEEEFDGIVTALQFYANENNHIVQSRPFPFLDIAPKVSLDFGKIAQQALAKIKYEEAV